MGEPEEFWPAFGKNLAYDVWNAFSFGTLARQDALVEKNLSGEISDTEYWARTGVNAASGVAILGATVATGGAAAGVAQGLGAGATATALIGGGAAGVGGQATSDIIELFGTGTKTLEDISAVDYLFAAGLGAAGGGLGGAAARPGAVRFNLNPRLRGLDSLDNSLGRVTQTVEQSTVSLGGRSFEAGQGAAGRLRTPPRATTVVETRPPSTSRRGAPDESVSGRQRFDATRLSDEQVDRAVLKSIRRKSGARGNARGEIVASADQTESILRNTTAWRRNVHASRPDMAALSPELKGTFLHSSVQNRIRSLNIQDLSVNQRLYGTSQYTSPATGAPFEYRVPDFKLRSTIFDIKPFGTPLSGPQYNDFVQFGVTTDVRWIEYARY